MEDIYKSEKVNNQWAPAKNVGPPINSNQHDATVYLTSDGQTLYIYRSENNNGGDIYECKLNGNQWTNPVPLTAINTKYQETSVSISPDGKTLYFVTNKPGGIGGKDIYTATLDKTGNWTNIKNIGKTINTKKDEDAVFIHPDGKTLYFSSQGHNSIGGYDIFMTTLQEDGSWSSPKNIGIPINTADDDVFFVMAANGKHAYYASGKIGGLGEKDIYLIEFKEEEKNITLLKGIVLDQNDEPVTTSINIYNIETGELINSINTNSASGSYLVSLNNGTNYQLTIKYKQYPDIIDTLNLSSIKGYHEITKDFKFKLPPAKKDSIPPVQSPDYVYTIQFLATDNYTAAISKQKYLEQLGIENVYIQKVIFTDTNEKFYRVRSGKFDTFQEAEKKANSYPKSKLPNKEFWIDNVREDNYSVEKLSYTVIKENIETQE